MHFRAAAGMSVVGASLVIVTFACDGKLSPGVANPDQDDDTGALCKGAGSAGTASAELTVLVRTGQGEPSGIAVDATNVYWTNSRADGAIMRLPKSGGASAPLVDNQLLPQSIFVDATHVYWSGIQGPNPPVLRRPLGGTTVETIDSTGALGFAQDRNNVYWVGDTTGGIRRMPKSGGPVVDLAPGLPGPLGSPVGLAVGEGRVYRSVRVTGKIVSVPVGGGAVETLVSGLQAPTAIAVDATHVYWLDQEAATLSSVPIGGGAITKLADTGWLPRVLALDCGSLYWANTSPCMQGAEACARFSFDWPSVQKVAVGGGAVTTLARGQNPTAIAIDETSIYWTNMDDVGGDAGKRDTLGAIVRSPK